MSRTNRVEIGICRDCGGEVWQRGRNTYRCLGCGAEWDIEHEPDRWRFGTQVDRADEDDGTGEWDYPEAHGQSTDDIALLPRVAAVGWGLGGVFGATLAALTSPLVAVALVCLVVLLGRASIAILRRRWF